MTGHIEKWGRVLVLVGPSAAGKTTIAKRVMQLCHRARLITSRTTREYRISDLPREYEYISLEEMRALDQAGELVWIKERNTTFYATTKKSIEEVLDQPGTTGIMILTPDSLEPLKDFIYEYTESWTQFIPIFLIPPERHRLKQRMLNRGDSNRQDIEYRLDNERTWEAEARESTIPFRFVRTDVPFEVSVDCVMQLLE